MREYAIDRHCNSRLQEATERRLPRSVSAYDENRYAWAHIERKIRTGGRGYLDNHTNQPTLQLPRVPGFIRRPPLDVRYVTGMPRPRGAHLVCKACDRLHLRCRS